MVFLPLLFQSRPICVDQSEIHVHHIGLYTVYKLDWTMQVGKIKITSQPLSDQTYTTSINEIKLINVETSVYVSNVAPIFLRLPDLMTWQSGSTFLFPSDTSLVSDFAILYTYISVFQISLSGAWSFIDVSMKCWLLNWFAGMCCRCLEFLRLLSRRHRISIRRVSPTFPSNPFGLPDGTWLGWNLTFIKNEARTSINNEGFK